MSCGSCRGTRSQARSGESPEQGKADPEASSPLAAHRATPYSLGCGNCILGADKCSAQSAGGAGASSAQPARRQLWRQVHALACRLDGTPHSKIAPLRHGANMTEKALAYPMLCREAALGQGTASVAQLAEEVREVPLLS